MQKKGHCTLDHCVLYCTVVLCVALLLCCFVAFLKITRSVKTPDPKLVIVERSSPSDEHLSEGRFGKLLL